MAGLVLDDGEDERVEMTAKDVGLQVVSLQVARYDRPQLPGCPARLTGRPGRVVTEPVVHVGENASPLSAQRVRGWTIWTLRLFVTVHAILVFIQPVLAGLFVTGDVGMLGLHSAVAVFLTLFTPLQVIAAVLLWRPGRGAAWPIWISVLLLFLEQTQAGFGYSRQLALHFPLGVLIFGIAMVMLVWVWTPGARVRRVPRRRGAVA